MGRDGTLLEKVAESGEEGGLRYMTKTYINSIAEAKAAAEGKEVETDPADFDSVKGRERTSQASEI